MLVFDTKKIVIYFLLLIFLLVSVFLFINFKFKTNKISNVSSDIGGEKITDTDSLSDVIQNDDILNKEKSSLNDDSGALYGLDFVVYLVGKSTRVRVNDNTLGKEIKNIIYDNNIDINKVTKIIVNGKVVDNTYKTQKNDIVMIYLY